MPVEYSSYWISADDLADDEPDGQEFAPGFAQWQPGQVTVICSDAYRGVDITVEIVDAEPSVVDDDEWQDIVEFGLTTEDGDIRLLALMDGPRGPNLASGGAGDYRFRLAAWGRDPIDGRKPREQHHLTVWRVENAGPPAVLRLTSDFAADWAAPEPPRRQIDWAQLATQRGVRLIVGWRDLAQPSGDPSALEPTVVTVTGILEGTPAQVFKTFHSPYLASIGAGGCSPVVELGGTFHCDVQHETYLEEFGEPPPDWWPWIGRLEMVGTWTDIQRFRSLALTLQFQDLIFRDETRPAMPHPLPRGLVSFQFAKHANGREVTVSHHDVPRWLAEDVRELWQIVLERHRKHSDYALPMPWSDWAHLAG
jgi:hypothetical protein